MRIVPFVLVAALAACSGASTAANAPHNMSVAFSAVPQAGVSGQLAAAAPAVAGDVTVSDAAHTLVISRVQLVVGELELSTATATACSSDSTQHSSDCEEMELGPMLVDVPLDAGATVAVAAPVPAGSYREVSFKIRAVKGDDASAAAFLAAHPDFTNVSVRVDGTFDGQPFTYTSSLEAEAELELPSPVVVDHDGMNVTVHVDVSTWFTTDAGAVIDPATAVAGGVNADLVASRIHASFEAFEDDNHDGRS